MDVLTDKGSTPLVSRRMLLVIAAGITLFVGLVYLLFPSAIYNGDGLGYAKVVETASTSRLWSIPARLFFCPIGRIVQQLLGAVGWEVRSVYVLQAINSIFGSLAAGVFFLIAFRISRSVRLALMVSLGFAFSLAVWFWNINVTSYPGNVFFLVCCLYLLISSAEIADRRTFLRRAAAVALVHALAAFFWLPAVLLGPSIALIFLFVTGRVSRNIRLVAAAVYSISFLIFLFVPLVIAGVQTAGVSNVETFLSWLASASHKKSPDISLKNFFRGIIGFSSSVFHMTGLGPFVKNLLWNVPFVPESRPKMYSEIAAFLLLWLTIGSMVFYYLRFLGRSIACYRRCLMALIVWAVPIMLFGLIWLGSDTERWLAVSPIFWLLLLIGVSHACSQAKPTVAKIAERFLWSFTAIIILYNLISVVLPDHDRKNNPYWQKAEFLSAQMTDQDLVLLWGHDHVFTGSHLGYFFNKKWDHLGMLGNKYWDDIEERIVAMVDEVRRRGGRVLIIGRIFLPEDLPESRYSPSEERVDRIKLGEILSRWERRPAFTYEKDTYWLLVKDES